jgi:hypothetical protein
MNATVAGVNIGAGADDVVLVRDCVDLDLSRNSTIACKYLSTHFAFAFASVLYPLYFP